MPSLFTKVKAKMDLYTHEKVRSLLDGQYGSVFKGRSLDFDDLREYIPGDDIKDIDWSDADFLFHNSCRHNITVKACIRASWCEATRAFFC